MTVTNIKLVIAAIIITISYISYLIYNNSKLEDNLDRANTEIVIKEKEHIVKQFESNQSIIISKEKEKPYEKIPTSIGTHTIRIK